MAPRNKPHRIPGPELTYKAGLRDALMHKGTVKKESRLGRFMDDWLFGSHGIGGASKDLAHSVDPRTPLGALNLAGMLLPGKPNAESAMAAHLGHSEFRPYDAVGTRGQEEGFVAKHLLPDQVAYGGQMAWQHGADMGYPNFGKRMRDVHGYSLHELLGLIPSKRIADRNLLNKVPGGGFLHEPYRYTRNLNN